jgi:hypothetical protein
MNIHRISPNDPNKNLGKAYNQAMQIIPDGDWACITDLDVLFLTPDAGNIIYNYASQIKEPQNCFLTCFTNRIHPLAKDQLLNAIVNEDDSMKNHIMIAEEQKKHLYKTSVTKGSISGLLMLMHKDFWKQIQFNEDNKCLGVDSDLVKRTRSQGKQILRMDGLYVWHTYRLTLGINYKGHLI